MDDLLPLEPREPEIAGYCKWCGGEIYKGEAIYCGDEGTAHRECIGDMLMEILGAALIAEQFGYRQEVA